MDPHPRLRPELGHAAFYPMGDGPALSPEDLRLLIRVLRRKHARARRRAKLLKLTPVDPAKP